jgi:DNA-binding IclR family transcriptional regulator
MAGNNQSLDRGLAILELIDAEGGALGVREIARRMALSPTIVQRLVHSLVDSSFLMKEPSSQKYSLGYRALSLGSSLLTEDNLISAALPELSSLARDLEVNAFLSVRNGDRLVYVLALQSEGPISLRTGPGSFAGFHSTAMGKALLADEEPAWVEAFLKRTNFEQHTAKTLTDPAKLRAELERVGRLGFAISNEENLPGVIAAGTTVRNAKGLPVAGVSVAYAPSLQPQIVLASAIRQLLITANNISQSLGCPTASLHDLATAKAVG